MKVRLISSAVGIVGILALLYVASFWSYAIDIVLSIAITICIGEALNAGGVLKKYVLSIPCLLFGLLLPYLIYTPYLISLVYVLALLTFASMIFNHKNIYFYDVCFAVSFTALISFGMSSLISLYNDDRAMTVFFVVIGLAMPWLSDSGAYFAGVFLGKHKLCPEISPKKTVEGAIGGVIAGALLMLLTGFIFESLVFPLSDISREINYVNILIYGFICSFISMLGDLTFSLLKRNYKIKDFGSIIPGHGGLLDRLDSVIFTLPALYIIYSYLPILK